MGWIEQILGCLTSFAENMNRVEKISQPYNASSSLYYLYLRDFGQVSYLCASVFSTVKWAQEVYLHYRVEGYNEDLKKTRTLSGTQ